MYRAILLTLGMLFANHLLACESEDIRKQLSQLESQTLLKNAPTFRHAWDDGRIALSWQSLQTQDQRCVAQLTISLPEADLAEANQFMEQNPAKRILLAAQGYVIPEQAKQTSDYFYHVQDGKVLADNEANFALRQLHSNLEYTYQLLAQIRISINAESSNKIAWSEQLKKEEHNQCMTSGNSSPTACECRVKELEKHISPRQRELIEFIRSQPYSVATGSMESYLNLSKKIDSDCKQ